MTGLDNQPVAPECIRLAFEYILDPYSSIMVQGVPLAYGILFDA